MFDLENFPYLLKSIKTSKFAEISCALFEECKQWRNHVAARFHLMRRAHSISSLEVGEPHECRQNTPSRAEDALTPHLAITLQVDASAGPRAPQMCSELHSFPRVEHAGTAAAPAVVVGSVGVDIDRRRSVRRHVGAGDGDVAGQSRRCQPDGSADADVATRAIPRGPGRQRSRRDVAHPPLADDRSELVVVVFPTSRVVDENERVPIEESAARRGRQHVDLGCVTNLY